MFDQISVTGRGSLEIRLWSLIIGDEEVDQVNNMQSAPDYRPVNFDLNKKNINQTFNRISIFDFQE